MKKIGIVTFHASYNCGSILQTMALQDILKHEYNVDNKVINFSSLEQRKLYSVFYQKITLKNVIKNILCIPGVRVISNHYREYKDFINNNIELTNEFYPTNESLFACSSTFDGYICGSDQVWNVKCDDFDDAYFLNFVKEKPKIAYAPSLGATNINKVPNHKHYKDLLFDFVAISTRENNGSKWIGELIGRDIPVVLDPTLLFNGEYWSSKIKFIPDKPECEFIFYYAFGYNDGFNLIIDKYALENNLKVVVIDSKQWYIKRLYRFKSFYLSKNTGPNAFLYFMKNAKYVVTASFHGCAFSINFHKQFVYLQSKTHETSDDRTSEMLKRLGLLDRIINPANLPIKITDSLINYDEVDKKKAAFQYESKQYLEKALRDCKLI